MKKGSIKYLLLVIGLLVSVQLSAQEYEEKLVVPLSKPGAKGSLEVGLIMGSIKVEGYNGKEVIVTAKAFDRHSEEGRRERYRERSSDNKTDLTGLKKISSNGFELDIEEKDNHVEISSDHFNKRIDLEIKVPTNFSLELGTVNNGDIYVSNVSGNHEISNVNGDIEMHAISGSVVASTVNGKLVLEFDKVAPNTPMAFAGMNKNIDLTLPADTKATLKMDSKMGEIYTDFDAELVKSGPEVKKTTKSGVYKVSVSQTVTAKLNGGGPEFKFKNFNGDIIVRKKK
jgi:hypothetical protein